jgi:predicted nucleic acid-binding protein
VNAIVLDASIILAWCFRDDATGVADAAFRQLKISKRWAPSLLFLEVANLLALSERKKRISPADAQWFVEKLSAYDLVVDSETSERALHETRSLAREYGLTAYDAAYLELAVRKGAVLATLDQDLRRAAVKAGVPVIRV